MGAVDARGKGGTAGGRPMSGVSELWCRMPDGEESSTDAARVTAGLWREVATDEGAAQ